MVVRCTKKMLDLLGGRSVTLVDLRAVLDRLAANSANDLSDEDAIELAVEEVRAVRAERRRGK